MECVVFSLDDRTGNVVTTVAVFAAAIVAAFLARATLVVFVLGLLLAYLLEPIVAGVGRVLPSGPRARSASIAIVYAIGALVLVAVDYTIAPRVVDQSRRLSAALPDLAARLNATVAEHGDLVSGVVTRLIPTVTVAAQDIGWLLMVPIVAIFFLGNRTAFLEKSVDVFARRADRADVTRTIQRVDEVLAEYTRAQLLCAGLSAGFYWLTMALLGFPYPLLLAIVGGALEFVPAVGWITAAAAILVSGWLGHAHWIWMVPLLGVWRLVQNFIISPRVMGDRLNMEPITVLFALMVGAQLGGLTGVILSIPVLAVFRIVRDEQDGNHHAQISIAARTQPDIKRG
jgi:predicted PurR-regulated permease PerM